MVVLSVRNESARKWLYRRDQLGRLAERICRGEGVAGRVEVSVLFCDDAFMRGLNQEYRDKNAATDVLAFEQAPRDASVQAGGGPPRVLGDIVISLETVEHNCNGDRGPMREEVAMLFCHGLLHLLGHDHGTAREGAEMKSKQADYLDRREEAAWHFGAKTPVPNPSR